MAGTDGKHPTLTERDIQDCLEAVRRGLAEVQFGEIRITMLEGLPVEVHVTDRRRLRHNTDVRKK